MTLIDMYITEQKAELLEERQRLQRHENFIHIMELNKEDKNIDWSCYWSWYYHSDECDAETALLKARG